ncbi:MAG: hypothetical protein KC442_09355 [Thermomicrobiales bacterium]|nr:hypothetical protein [Thermomicrobiales bacterium]
MDGRSFDNLLRSLTESRRSLVGSALAAGGIIAGLTSTEAKRKKKKKCAKMKIALGVAPARPVSRTRAMPSAAAGE